jgi:hypothetical protein
VWRATRDDPLAGCGLDAVFSPAAIAVVFEIQSVVSPLYPAPRK